MPRPGEPGFDPRAEYLRRRASTDFVVYRLDENNHGVKVPNPTSPRTWAAPDTWDPKDRKVAAKQEQARRMLEAFAQGEPLTVQQAAAAAKVARRQAFGIVDDLLWAGRLAVAGEHKPERGPTAILYVSR